MADLLQFPRLVQQPVIQTRGPGRRPKSITSLCDILLNRKRDEAQARCDQARNEKLKAALSEQDLMTIERQENGTWRLRMYGLYSEPDRAIKVLRECAIKVTETYGASLPAACAVLPIAASRKGARHG